MLRSVLAIIVLSVLLISGLIGCKKGPSGTEGREEVKTTAEYETEAREQINKKNMAEELRKIEEAMEKESSEEE